MEGLLKALDHIDEVIKIIRGSANVQAAKAQLMERFDLSDAQAQAIVDMRLRARPVWNARNWKMNIKSWRQRLQS